MKHWINAFRLRTLPLTFSCIIIGCGMSFVDGYFSFLLAVLLLMTTLFLQILSNLANDYGDFVKGADGENRVGPERALQSGNISKPQMIKAIVFFILLSCISGSVLLYFGTRTLGILHLGIFILLGISSIAAAIMYSIGKKAYGYAGMGDIAVFLFFGWLGVLGAYYLQAHTLKLISLLPASGIGLLSVAVLNINNMRDHIEDAKVGKCTLVTVLGLKWSKRYYLFLNMCAVLCMSIYMRTLFSSMIILFSGIVLFGFQTVEIIKSSNHTKFDPFLKKQALGTFIYSLIFILVLCFYG